ncbi:MAG: endonuclease V [Litorilinea sp.]|nr:MAG: endonuclease V [Litorilinea sp.]
MAWTLHHAHRWDVSVPEAIRIQEQLAPLVREEPLPAAPTLVAGVDMSVRQQRVQAAVVVLRLPDLTVVDQAIWRGPVDFPYVPGLLSFREVPAVIAALERLQARPDVILADAQGRAHPRRLGLASHLGVLLDLPTVGVAKSRLVGTHEPPGPEKGATAPLFHGEELVGMVVRTRAGVRPVFVSVGHRITLDQAVALTLACTTRYRLPEPTRLAHLASRRAAGPNQEA